MNEAYRDDLDILRGKIKELRKRYLGELFSVSPVFFDVYQKRVRRIWAGAAGIAGAAILALYSLTEDTLSVSQMLFGVILFPFIAAIISQLFVGRLLLQKLLAVAYSSDEPHSIYERLQSESAQKNLRAAVEKVERLSVGLPLVALSLLAPLTIHMLLSLLLGSFSLYGFGSWILLSLLMVGHSHLILAYYAWSYSRELAESQTCEFATLSGRGWTALWLVTAYSLFPGVIFTSGLVFLTGLLFVPAMFGWASWVLSRERTAIEIAS